MLTADEVMEIVESELEAMAIRSQGPGGQNVNKVSSAVQLRFDINASALPVDIKQRLSALRDHRVSRRGVILIKAQRFRSQEKNRADAMVRLHELIESALHIPTLRKNSRTPLAEKRRRLENKTRRAGVKSLRGKVLDDN